MENVKWAWEYIGQDNTMTKDVSDPNHYTFEITPTISEFFSLGDDTDVNYIGVIVRDENKNKSQDSNLYIPSHGHWTPRQPASDDTPAIK